MNELRVLLATSLFAIGVYLVYDLIAHGFDLAVLVGGVAGFALAHVLWPHDGSGEASWYDMLEWVVDLPYRAVALALRSLGRLLRFTDVDL